MAVPPMEKFLAARPVAEDLWRPGGEPPTEGGTGCLIMVCNWT